MDLIKSRNIVIPIYLYNFIRSMKLELDEFVALIYLYNQGEKVIFNPNKIASELGFSLQEVMLIIGKLTELKLISLDVSKNDKGIMEEYISLTLLIEKLSLDIIGKLNANDEDTDVFSLIEKEFGRTLSPIEYEIVKAWRDNNFTEEIIIEALKEATFNGVNNLRYIDKILYEWSKKGIKTKKDVDKNRVNFKEKKKEKVEVFEYNWLEENDED